MDLFEFVPLATLSAFVWKLVDFAKFLRAWDPNAVVTQVAAWVAGVLAVWAVAASDLADQAAAFGFDLVDLGAGAKVLAGVAVGSVASVVFDLKQALDQRDSAATPRLVNRADQTPRAG